jgi:hypothetical protein
MATNPYDQQILDQIARMDAISNAYKPAQISIPDFSAIAHQYDGANVLKPVDFSTYAKDLFATPASKTTDSGWLAKLGAVLSGTLGQIGGAVVNTGYNQIQNYKDIGNVLSSNEPLWKKIFDVTGDISPTKAIMQTALSAGVNGAKEQWKDWTDGKLSWGDVPGVGFLHGTDEGWKRGSDILDSLGVTNKWGKTIGGIGIDILGDPLTYLTGGLATASKLGEASKIAKVGEIAGDMTNDLAKVGIDASKIKDADSLISAAKQAYTVKYAQYPNLVTKMVDKKIADIQDAIKTAQNTAFNSHINTMSLSIPFTNKALPIGNIKEGSLLYRSEATLGSDYQHIAQDAIAKAAGNDATKTKQLEQAVLQRYGVSSLADLTKTHVEDLTNRLNSFKSVTKGLPEVSTVQNVIKTIMPQAQFDNIMTKFAKDNIPWKDVQNQLDQILTQTAHDPLLRESVGSQLAKMVSDFWKTKPAKNFSGVANARKAEAMNWAANFLKDSGSPESVISKTDKVFPKGDPAKLANLNDKQFYKNIADMTNSKFNEMNNAKTGFEHLLDKHNPFDARTLKTGSKFKNSMADHISDAQSQIVGNKAKYTMALKDIKGYIKKENITNDEMKQAIYHLEGHAPDSLGGSAWQASDRVKTLADKIRPVLDTLGKDEMNSGSLNGLRQNYFPHVLNHSEEDMKKWQEFIDRHPELKNLKGTNNFNNVRKTFQTIAQRDNYIAKLEKAVQKETDPATIETLRNQIDKVANMFDTDVVSALTRRIREGVRSSAMKEMQGNLSKFGMMKSIEKGMKNDPSIKTDGLKELDKTEVKKLGLDPNKVHYMNPDVLKGLQRVDDVFTNEGMNKFVRHMTAINDIWRPLVTFYKPSHYRNNLIGNAIVNMAAGVKVSDYKVAGKLIKGYRAGTLTPEQMKIMDSAYKHNVVSGGFLHDGDASYRFSDPTKLEKIAKKVGDNKAIKYVRGKGEIADDVTRLANYVNGLNKFGSAAQAAKQVRTYLFNYNELTNADRGMRVIVPFWNWTKRNIPLQMKLLLDSPKFALNQERFKDLFNNGQDGKDYQKENGIKIPFTNYYTSLPFPTSDLQTVLNPLSELGSMNPAIKVPIELQTNKQLFNGSPISYGSQTVKPEDLPRYLMSQLGGKDIYNMASGNKSVLETLANLVNPISKANPKQ